MGAEGERSSVCDGYNRPGRRVFAAANWDGFWRPRVIVAAKPTPDFTRLNLADVCEPITFTFHPSPAALQHQLAIKMTSRSAFSDNHRHDYDVARMLAVESKALGGLQAASKLRFSSAQALEEYQASQTALQAASGASTQQLEEKLINFAPVHRERSSKALKARALEQLMNLVTSLTNETLSVCWEPALWLTSSNVADARCSGYGRRLAGSGEAGVPQASGVRGAQLQRDPPEGEYRSTQSR